MNSTQLGSIKTYKKPKQAKTPFDDYDGGQNGYMTFESSYSSEGDNSVSAGKNMAAKRKQMSFNHISRTGEAAGMYTAGSGSYQTSEMVYNPDMFSSADLIKSERKSKGGKNLTETEIETIMAEKKIYAVYGTGDGQYKTADDAYSGGSLLDQ